MPTKLTAWNLHPAPPASIPRRFVLTYHVRPVIQWKTCMTICQCHDFGSRPCVPMVKKSMCFPVVPTNVHIRVLTSARNAGWFPVFAVLGPKLMISIQGQFIYLIRKGLSLMVRQLWDCWRSTSAKYSSPKSPRHAHTSCCTALHKTTKLVLETV